MATKAKTGAADKAETTSAPAATVEQIEAAPTLNLELKAKKLTPGATLPEYQSLGAACFDLHADLSHLSDNEPVQVAHGFPQDIGTGLAFEIPKGFVMLVFSRSGHGFKSDIRLSNAVGIVDQDYRGEVRVKLTADNARKSLNVRHGDRIAQAMLIPVFGVTIVEATEDLVLTERGAEGFGSTGA